MWCKFKEGQKSCVDVEGQRKSGCPCLKSKTGCSTACGCKNCSNPCGSREAVTEQTTKNKASRAPRKKSYQPKRTSAYLVETGVDAPMGRWSDAETLTLILLSNILKRTGLPVNVSHLDTFYRMFRHYLCNKELLKELPINIKEVKHITAKLQHINVQYF